MVDLKDSATSRFLVWLDETLIAFERGAQMKAIGRTETISILAGVIFLGVFGSTTRAAGPSRVLDPLTLPVDLRHQALHGPLGDRDYAGAPADAGCTWSRFQAPTPQGLRWLLEEDCSDTGFRSH